MEANEMPAGSGRPSEPPRPGSWTYLLFTLASMWVVMAGAIVHLPVFGVHLAWIHLKGAQMPGFHWVGASWAYAALAALPVVPLALLTQVPRFRAIYRCWALAAACTAALAPAQSIPVRSVAAGAAAQTGLTLLLIVLILRAARRRGYRPGFAWKALLPALAIVPVLAAPWIGLGALGSPLDAALGLAAGLSFGVMAALLLELFLVQPMTSDSTELGWEIALGGFAAGVVLLLLGSGFGAPGSHLLLMLALPPLGWAALAARGFARPGSPEDGALGQGAAWLPAAALLGGPAGAALAFFDPDELLPQLFETQTLAFGAAGLTALLAWIAGWILWACRDILRMPRRPAWPAGTFALTAACCLLMYFYVGYPGFYGDRIFVILREQADLSAAAGTIDRNARLDLVYTTLTRHAETSQADIRKSLDRFGVRYRPYYLLNGLEVDGGPLVRAMLAARPEVDRILHVPRLRPAPRGFSPMALMRRETAPPWNIAAIGADRVWQDFGVTGSGIVIGHSDTGAQWDHPALREGYRGRDGQHDYNWLDAWDGAPAPYDPIGHGTHTVGTAVGRGGIGVAPGAQWFSCANLMRSIGNVAYYLDCLQFMLAPYPVGGDPFGDGRPDLAAHVTTNSWACPEMEGCDPEVFSPALRAMRSAGIFTVVGAGNSGPTCGSILMPPAVYPEAFTVAASDGNGNVAPFSSRGPGFLNGRHVPKPDIAAPGTNVFSSFPNGTWGASRGTSMATPHVAGVVALVWSAQPKLIGDIERTERLLTETARPAAGNAEAPPLTASGPLGLLYPRSAAECGSADVARFTSGHGIVDAYAAVKAALEMKD